MCGCSNKPVNLRSNAGPPLVDANTYDQRIAKKVTTKQTRADFLAMRLFGKNMKDR